MNFNEAMQYLTDNKDGKVRLPEWSGYWFNDENGDIAVLTRNGDILRNPWFDKFKDREDWVIAKGLDFGWAINAIKNGKLVTRQGWNSKGTFVFMRPFDVLTADFVIDKVKSLPQSVKDYYKAQCEKIKHEPSNVEVKFTEYLCMKAVDGSIINGWLPSQTDMLAEDWQLFEY